MTLGFKGASLAAIFGISYINHVFSPLIWGLLILIMADVLLNVHKEGQQFTKIGSAFATLGGTSILTAAHAFNLEALHGIVAVMVLAYIQIVAPQIVLFVSKAHFIAPGAKAAMIEALKAENEMLKHKAEVTKAEAENKVIISNGESK